MEFIKSADATAGTAVLLKLLKQELASGKRVLWLVSGGAAIASETKILRALRRSGHKENLAIVLMDERFGAVGHADSNWQQLIDAGCDFTGLHAIPVMTKPEKSLNETVKDYAKLIKVAMDAADMIIGQFGVGADGHTAGMLPDSPAVRETTDLVVGYESSPYTRITLTRQALRSVDAAYVFVYGTAKHKALADLLANQKPFAQLPSKIFWDLPEAYIYNDQVGETQ